MDDTAHQVHTEQRDNKTTFFVVAGVVILIIVVIGVVLLIHKNHQSPVANYTNPFTPKKQQTTYHNPFSQPTTAYQNPFATQSTDSANKPYQNPFGVNH